jgi:hypothetical protein
MVIADPVGMSCRRGLHTGVQVSILAPIGGPPPANPSEVETVRSLRSTPVLASVALVAAVVARPAGAAAQDPPSPSCAVVSPAEVNAIFAGTDLAFGDNSARYYCTFRGTFDLTISVMTDTDLAAAVAGFGEGEFVTVAGAPAWWQESSGNFAVEAKDSVVFMNGWKAGATDAETQARLAALAALVAPRIPPGPDAAAAAELSALLPPSVAADMVTAVPGWFIVPIGDTSTPERLALQGLLASAGRTTADLVLVGGSDGVDGVVYLAKVPGIDPSALLLLLLGTLLPGAMTAPISVVDIDGHQVVRVGTEPPMAAFVRGDAVVYASGSDAFVLSVLAPAS